REDPRVHGMTGEGFERGGPDEVQGCLGRHDTDVVAGFGESAQNLAGLVGRDATADPENDPLHISTSYGRGRRKATCASTRGRAPHRPVRRFGPPRTRRGPARVPAMRYPEPGRGRRGRPAEPSSLAFGVLEKACVDLAERDGQRLLARTRLDERADVLEQALTELRVVVVDLARTLGRVDHERVLRADLVEQV